MTSGVQLRGAMTARSPHEAHRAATPLELLFDLVFVVAIAQAANGLHHAITADHALEGLISYFMVFFAIWWAWMNFTWFASAYDCDDVLYRLAVFVQIAGALMMAGGVTAMFETRAPNLATIGGYAVMRLALVAQWLRAAASDPPRRKTGHRYAAGITVLQLAWIALLFVPEIWIPAFLIVGGARIGAASMGGGRSADHLAPASHRGTIRSAHTDCARESRSLRRPSPSSRRCRLVKRSALWSR